MRETHQALDDFGRTVIRKIEDHFPKVLRETIYAFGELTVVIDPAFFVDVCGFLRDAPELSFNSFRDLSAVDLWPENPRFEINVHLLSIPKQLQSGPATRRLRIKVRLEEHDATLSTLTGVWPSSAWYERETHELFGINFDGHPDLRPLLLPDDWEGPPPMRRDIPVHVEEVAFSFNQERIYRNKRFAKE